jgi:predicted transcriptional regulator
MTNRTFVVSIGDDTSEQLDELASNRGLSPDVFVQHALESVVLWEQTALRDHEEGLRQIERGEFYTNEEVRALLDAALRQRAAA